MSTMIRGATELNEVRELFAQLNEVETGLGIVNQDANRSPRRASEPRSEFTIVLTREEVKDVLIRRRDGVLLRLSNKGIEVRPDAASIPVE
jgi:hypothetical protein